MPKSVFEPCSPAAPSDRRETGLPEAITVAAAACTSAMRTRAGGLAPPIGVGLVAEPSWSPAARLTAYELLRQRRGPLLGRCVPLQLRRPRVRVPDGLLQPGEQVPQIPLPGVRATLPVTSQVIGEEPVEPPRVAGGEIPVDAVPV